MESPLISIEGNVEDTQEVKLHDERERENGLSEEIQEMADPVLLVRE